MALSSGDPWAYTPPLSLWKLVEQNVPPKEQEEIKHMLGTSLVETTLDLHNEVNMLLEIWQDCQDKTESEIHDRSQLAEPPHVRERLIKEISFLAKNVQENSLKKGLSRSDLFSRNNSQILDYAEETLKSGSSTARWTSQSSDGRQTPISPSEQARSRAELSSLIEEDVTSANRKLNYLQFDEVCFRLRETLTKEIQQLEADVLFLQGCIDDAANASNSGSLPALSREPTIAELREQRTLLEKELISTENIPSTPSVNKPAFFPSHSNASMKMQNLGPIKPKRKIVQSPSSSGTSKTSPLKVSYHMAHLVLSPPLGSSHSCATSEGLSSSNYKAKEKTTLEASVLETVSTKNMCQVSRKTHQRDHSETLHSGVDIRKQEGSYRHRHTSPARVKVVPVGSIHDARADLTSGQSFIPTAPSAAEKPQLPRPSSAERFRKMVMHYREAT